MTCREFAEFLGDYLSGELSGDVLASFERHLGVCENCEKYLAGYRESVLLGKLAFANADDSPPVDVPQDLVDAILAARRTAG